MRKYGSTSTYHNRNAAVFPCRTSKHNKATALNQPNDRVNKINPCMLYIYRAVLHGGYCDYDESQRQYRDIWICIYANAQFIVQIYRKYIAQTTRIQETNTYRRKWRPRDADASDGRDPETHRESRLLLTIGSCCVCYWPLWKRDKLVKLNTKPALCCGGFWFSCLRGVGGQIDRTESKRQTKQGKSTKAGNFGYKKRNNFTCFSPKSEYGL